ncbi:MFS transporter [Kineobactrum sediminis]|uniref:Bcr/CflA family efflux transporter n=1 Tax=Kineobactrum sediminis TaxID=1905677 RepID=A0A2N5Y7L7_9GAMM|nr:multidrug effflux MFS transporter [Kineobactrum sediminis]PLW84369.1 MFS transporter [Kineobactrum sediminis]
MKNRHLTPDSPWLLGLLASLAALGPLTIDMYLPAMPAMRSALDTHVGAIQLTLSAYLVGFAVFHLLCGPLADRFGRKPVIASGIVLFIMASIGCSLSVTVEQLLVFRFLQGVGACVGPTLARTIARDLFGPRRAARALSLIAMLMALAPAVAPTLGGWLMLAFPWPSIFVFLAVYASLILLLLTRYLGESLPHRQSLHPRVILRNYSVLLRSGPFMTVVVTSSLVYAGLMVYLASSAFVYLEMLGVPLKYFGAIFLTTVVGYISGSALSARLAGRFSSHRVVLLGIGLAAASSLSMAVAGMLLPESVLALMLPMMFYTAGLGLTLPHAMSLALHPYPHMAGTASALLGFIQMAVSAAASALIGLFLVDSPTPMLIALVLTSGAALALGGKTLNRQNYATDS